MCSCVMFASEMLALSSPGSSLAGCGFKITAFPTLQYMIFAVFAPKKKNPENATEPLRELLPAKTLLALCYLETVLYTFAKGTILLTESSVCVRVCVCHNYCDEIARLSNIVSNKSIQRIYNTFEKGPPSFLSLSLSSSSSSSSCSCTIILLFY